MLCYLISKFTLQYSLFRWHYYQADWKAARRPKAVEWNSSPLTCTEHFFLLMALGQNHVEHSNYEKTLALPTNCLRSNEAELHKQFILIQALNDELKEKEGKNDTNNRPRIRDKQSLTQPRKGICMWQTGRHSGGAINHSPPSYSITDLQVLSDLCQLGFPNTPNVTNLNNLYLNVPSPLQIHLHFSSKQLNKQQLLQHWI